MSTKNQIKVDETQVEEMSKELLISRKNGFTEVTDEEIAKADAFCEGYKTFLDLSKTEREAVELELLKQKRLAL